MIISGYKCEYEYIFTGDELETGEIAVSAGGLLEGCLGNLRRRNENHREV